MVLMLAIAAGVAGFTLSEKNGTLVRNSLVASPMPASSFAWTPAEIPQDFLLETQPVPGWLAEKFPENSPGNTLTVVEQAVRALHSADFKGKAIRKDLRTTFTLIEEQGRGYCADYSKVFNALMHRVGLPVREWALGHENFGSGHTFNEVYFHELEKWVFVDSFNGMLVKDRASDTLLSVLEFRDRLAAGESTSLSVIKLSDPDDFFQTPEEGLDYYARSSDLFYLIWGNNVFSYETHPLVQMAANVARPLERFVAIAVGAYPDVRLLETDTNAAAISEIENVYRVLLLALIAEFLLGVLLLYLLWQTWREARANRQRPTG